MKLEEQLHTEHDTSCNDHRTCFCPTASANAVVDLGLSKLNSTDTRLIKGMIGGNIIDINEGIIITLVNCRGNIERGGSVNSLLFKKYPDLYDRYKSKTRLNSPLLGTILLVEVSATLKVILLFGQDGYGLGNNDINYEYLLRTLHATSNYIARDSVSDNVYIPFGLGCGMAKGNWEVVSDMIADTLPEAILVNRNKV